MTMPDPPLGEFSPITETARKCFHFAKRLTFMHLLSKKITLFRPRSALTPEEVGSKDFTRRRAFAVDMYILGWVSAELLLVLASLVGGAVWIRILTGVLAACRIMEIVQVTVNATILDSLSGRSDERVASRARMVIIAAINFIELCVCFGVLYASDLPRLHGAGQAATAFYFSVITQVTIGYGDVNPTGWLRIVAAFQALISLIFVILVFGRFVAALPQVQAIFGDAAKRD